MNDSETKLEPISTIVADSSTNSDHNNNNIKCRCGCVPNILSLFEMAALRDKKRREMKALADNNNNNNDSTRKNDDNNNNNNNNDDNNKTHKNDDDNNNNNNEIVDLVANLDTNVSLPLRIIGNNISSYLNNLNDDDDTDSDKISKSSVMTGILIGHGLGPKNPKEKSHLNDKYVDMALNAINEIDKNIIRPIITIAYTSRGHGDSTGWELTAASNPNQFTWMKLADDMVSLASKYQLPKFIACGSSMGAATSLYAAINNPDQVNAIIMMRPPTAWNDRLLRRKTLLSSANKCQEACLQGELHYLVIKGTAYSDLPSLEDYESYNKIKCPLLILAVEGDDSHPVSTAQAIKSMISHAELHISENDKKAKKIWPNLIKTFVEKVININT